MSGRPVVVTVTTYRRADLLPALLGELSAQADALPAPARIVVVDNDPARSAEAVVRASGVEYLPEPEPGIGHARRAALGAATEGELVAMLDDDLFPEPGWLTGLVDAWEQASHPTAVMGFVRYVWPEDCDPWIAAGGFMRRTRHATGTPLSDLATGSVLLDADDLRRRGVDFATDLGLSGGEDSRLGRDLLAAGGTIVASAESVARDDIPRDRTTVVFVRRRTIGHGATRSRLALRSATGARLLLRRIALTGGAAARLAVFSMVHLAGKVTRNLTRDATGMRRTWFAWGRLRGAWGRSVAEYERAE